MRELHIDYSIACPVYIGRWTLLLLQFYRDHKNTKGMDACASSYIMYGNVNKRLPVFAISICT